MLRLLARTGQSRPDDLLWFPLDHGPSQRLSPRCNCEHVQPLSGDFIRMSKLPSLVFFNAGEAARVRRSDGSERKFDEPTRGTIGFAESFLAGGVANYLGTYWPVNDTGAEAFATALYSALLRGDALGPSLIKGRHAVRDKKLGDWANYVLHGRPEFTLALGSGRQTNPV
jgi:CHAT domain